MKILVIGDVCGEPGVEFLSKNLRKLKQREQADLVIVNGENASMRGISPAQADEILYSGADVITLGNHAFANRQSWDYLDETRDVIRPLNLSPRKPGMGYTVVECCGKRVCVVNLMGQLNMDFSVDSPFRAMDALLKRQDADVYVVEKGLCLRRGRSGGGRFRHPYPRAHRRRAGAARRHGLYFRHRYDRRRGLGHRRQVAAKSGIFHRRIGPAVPVLP